jgi:3-hydroxyacyl-[acyl-carrier-protein] dehydratase
MPGVLLMESMAQTSGWLIIGITGFSRMPFLAAFSQAKLRAFVKPGDTLELTAALVHEGSGFARTKAEIRHDGKLACNAEITFRVVEFPNPEFRQHMQKAAAALAFPMEQLANG